MVLDYFCNTVQHFIICKNRLRYILTLENVTFLTYFVFVIYGLIHVFKKNSWPFVYQWPNVDVPCMPYKWLRNCMMLYDGHKVGTMHTHSHLAAFSIFSLSAFKVQNSRKKLENPEETQVNTGRTCKTPHKQ